MDAFRKVPHSKSRISLAVSRRLPRLAPKRFSQSGSGRTAGMTRIRLSRGRKHVVDNAPAGTAAQHIHGGNTVIASGARLGPVDFRTAFRDRVSCSMYQCWTVSYELTASGPHVYAVVIHALCTCSNCGKSVTPSIITMEE